MQPQDVIAILQTALTALQSVSASAQARLDADNQAIATAQSDVATQQADLAAVGDAISIVQNEISKLQGNPTPTPGPTPPPGPVVAASTDAELSALLRQLLDKLG